MIKFKAYTMMEMVIVMLISAVVITIAFTTYSILTKQFLNFRTKSDEVEHITLLDRLLSKDFSNCYKVLRSSYGVDCIYNDENISYIFEKEFILRTDHEIRDTFFIVPANLKIMFFKNEQADADGIVDEISFSQEYKEEIEVFRYTKKYGADVLMIAHEKKVEPE